jgi:hypothetical protein
MKEHTKQQRIQNLIDLLTDDKLNDIEIDLKEYIIRVINKSFDIDEKEEIISRICGNIG